MDEQKAREVLRGFIRPDDSLHDDGDCWVYWPDPTGSEGQIHIDGRLIADELEAMAWWIRNKARRDATHA